MTKYHTKRTAQRLPITKTMRTFKREPHDATTQTAAVRVFFPLHDHHETDLHNHATDLHNRGCLLATIIILEGLDLLGNAALLRTQGLERVLHRRRWSARTSATEYESNIWKHAGRKIHRYTSLDKSNEHVKGQRHNLLQMLLPLSTCQWTDRSSRCLDFRCIDLRLARRASRSTSAANRAKAFSPCRLILLGFSSSQNKHDVADKLWNPKTMRHVPRKLNHCHDESLAATAAASSASFFCCNVAGAARDSVEGATKPGVAGATAAGAAAISTPGNYTRCARQGWSKLWQVIVAGC